MKQAIVFSVIMLLNVQAFGSVRTNLSADNSDNSKINTRDRVPGAVTADQQSNATNDTKITQKIRQDIMNQKNLSTYAQNVKVISVNGMVTLKGPVRSNQEHTSLLQYARAAAGVSNVTDEMTVVTE